MQRTRRVPFAIWVTLWAIIVIVALALIITVVAWFANSMMSRPTGLSRGLCPELRGFVAAVAPSAHRFTGSSLGHNANAANVSQCDTPAPAFHTLFSLTASFPALCSRSGILSVHEDEPLAPPAGGAFFMRAVLCATGDASAALSGGFAGQRQGARSLPSAGQRVLGRQASSGRPT